MKHILNSIFLFLSITVFAQSYSRVEYFVDTDPGMGLAIEAPLPQGDSAEFIVDLTSINSGLHVLYIRVKDTAGYWSQTMRRPFLKQSISLDQLPNLMKAEYFIDADPGFGNATEVSGFSGDSLEMNVDLTSLSNGLHTLYVRSLDEFGNWSQTMRRPFLKSQIQTGVLPNVVQAEYFIDNVGEFGSGSSISITNPSPNVAADVLADLTGITVGHHTLYIRAKDSQGQWSMIQQHEFCNGAQAKFAVTDSIICDEGSVQFTNLTADASATTVYSWDYDGDQAADYTGSSAGTWYYDLPGIYEATLTVHEGDGLCENTFVQKIVISQPAITLSADLPDELYVYDSVQILADVTQVSDQFAIKWTVTGGKMSADTIRNPYFSAVTPNDYTVTATVTDIIGCSGAKSLDITVLPLVENFIAPDTLAVYRSKQNKIKTQYLSTENRIVWESMDESIATVSGNGLITCIANGTTVIRGTVDGTYTDEVTILVKDYVAIDRIVVMAAVGVNAGEQIKLNATILPRNASIQDIRWLSSDTSTAIVDAEGLVTALKQGTCNIIAVTVDGEIPSVTVLTVKNGQVDVERIIVPDTLYVSVGSEVVINAQLVPYYASDNTIAWTSTKPAIATVQDGFVTGIASGEARILSTPAQGTAGMTVVVVRGSAMPVLQIPVSHVFFQGETNWQIDLDQYVSDDNTADSDIIWGVSGGTNITVSLEAGKAGQITAADSEWSGTEVLTFTATDADGLQVSQKVEVTVSPTLNQAPELFFPNISATSSDAVSIDLGEYVSDDQNQIAEYSVVGSDNLAAEIVGGKLVVSPKSAEWSGTESISITVTDASGLSQSQTFSFTIDAQSVLIAPQIAPIPVQYSNSFGEFEKLYLNRYVDAGNSQIANLYWYFKPSLRLAVRIDNNTVTASSADDNWIGTERIWFYVENEAGMLDSTQILYVKQQSAAVKWTGSAQIDLYADRTIAPKGTAINLYPSMTGAESWKWVITGNGTTITSQELQPKVVLPAVGVYSVSLIAQNGNAIDTLTAENYISIFGITPGDTTICQGESVDFFINGTGLNKWTWENGSTETTYTVTPDSTQYISITVEKGLFVYADSVLVTVSQPFTFDTDTIAICAGDTAKINVLDGYASYSWNGISGSSAYESMVSGTVYLTVTDGANCVSNDSIHVTVNNLPEIALPQDTAICLNSSFDLSAPAGLTYTWSTGATSQSISVTEAGVYMATVENEFGCFNTDSVTIGVLSPFTEQIGVCTYSESSTAVITAWNRTPGMRTDHYELYRETGSAGNWDKIATVPYIDSCYFIDRDADAVKMAYNYKLITVDSVCANTAESTPHRTMHLVQSPGLSPTSANVEWSAYEGLTLGKYQVMKIRGGAETKLDDVLYADGREYYSYVDGTYLPGDRYRVVFDLPETIQLSSLKSDSGPFSQSLSNLSEAVVASTIAEAGDRVISIYPNPASDMLTAALNMPAFSEISVATMLGVPVSVPVVSIIGNMVTLDVSHLAGGMYILTVSTDGTEHQALFTKE